MRLPIKQQGHRKRENGCLKPSKFVSESRLFMKERKQRRKERGEETSITKYLPIFSSNVKLFSFIKPPFFSPQSNSNDFPVGGNLFCFLAIGCLSVLIFCDVVSFPVS